ncbi:MAG: biotin attachment protein, partial [Pirellulaceae bacterium]|nr:biotin attachment protein [Pirellulaceae bacterium]
ETIKQARAYLPEGSHIRFHSHDTAGDCTLCYMAALDAGADGIDLSMAPVSGGSCQPDVLTMWHVLRGTDYDLGVDMEKIREAEGVFQECMKDYFLPPEARAVEPTIPFSPMPGGALTANTQMMRDSGILDKYPSVICEMGEVVRRGGFGTSVTPVSQFYFQQAFNNAMFGKWKRIADGYGRMVLGYFGRTPVAPDPEIVRIAAEQLGLEPTTKTVLEINDADPKKGIDAAKGKLRAAGLPDTDENVFIAACCGEKGIAFLKGEAKVHVRKVAAATPPPSGCTVTIDGRTYAVTIDGNSASVNGKRYDYEVKDGLDEGAIRSSTKVVGHGGEYPVKSPLPGTVMRVVVKQGREITVGDTIVVLEAMKMETEVKAPVGGTVAAVSVSPGDLVASGQQIASIRQ